MKRTSWVVLILCLIASVTTLSLPTSHAEKSNTPKARQPLKIEPHNLTRQPISAMRDQSGLSSQLALTNFLPFTALAPFIDLQENGLTTVADGVGLLTWDHTTAQTLSVNVGGTVRFALLYWAGQDSPCTETDGVCTFSQPFKDQQMVFNGTPITGTVIGTENSGPAGSQTLNIGYFADVTSLVSAAGVGAHNFTFADGNGASNLSSLKGASLVVAYTDPAESRFFRVLVFDNLDYAFSGDTGTSPDAKVTAPVTFGHGGITTARTAALTIIAGDGESLKSDETTISNNPTLFNLLDSSDDNDGWDTDTVSVNIPANATSTVVQLVSTGPAPDELLWNMAMMRVPVFESVEPTCVENVTAGPPKQLTNTIQDTGSGLASIVVTKSENADTVVPPFVVGTTDPVVVTSTKIDQSQPMKIEIRVTDVDGNVHICSFDDTLCQITCPANITQSNDANQCGAVVNYPAPTTTGNCGTITCSPASGSFFPVGTTTVTCTSTNDSSCSFTVTVNDTQPPAITCPENISVIAEPNDPGTVIEYPNPTASDNCPGVTTSCTPASGSTFPTGTTTVTCTATDAANNTASCSFNVSVQCTADASFNNTSPLKISRFRENGPDGPTDEFVEIFNPSNSPHTVSSGTCSTGYGVFASAGNGTTANTVSLVCTIPNETVIPARGYYLCTGSGYSLERLGNNGNSSTAEGDAPIGCGGNCLGDIPNDAGLALINVGTNTVVNTLSGFAAAGLPDAALVVYDKIGFAPYGAGAPASGYPSLAGNFCEGTCLQPVGDASNLPTCTNSTELFPVVSMPPACYGQSGQYELLRRQTVFDPTVGTLHQDTNSNTADVLMVSPNPGINVGLNITGVAGVKPVLGVAAPHDHTAPPDLPTSVLSRTPFDVGPQTGPRNTERIYALDPTIANPNNNPLGTYALRFKYTNNSGIPLTSLRFSMDDLSTLCGPQNAAPETGTAEARNLSPTPNCQNGNTFSAILKLVNSAAEVVVDSTSTAQSVKGTVIEDLTGGFVIIGDLFTHKPLTRESAILIESAGPLSPLGGGVDNSLVVNPSTSSSSVGDGVNGGTGEFHTVIGTTEADKHLRVKVKFGVVRSGRFIILVVPMGSHTGSNGSS